MKPGRSLSLALFVAAMDAALTLAYAGQPAVRQAQQGAGNAAAATQTAGVTAGQSKNFSNIQVLKDIPEDQLLPSMQYISGALGVDCSFCHVTDKGHEGFASDDKRPKKTAREMMTMTMAINTNNFNGQPRVTCATCHAGRMNPNPVAPVLDDQRWQEWVDARARQQQAAAANPAGQQGGGQQQSPQAMQAAADAIFAKYAEAIGGDAAIAKLTTLQEKGTITTPHGDSAQFELRAKAPNKMAYTRTPANGQGMRIVSSDGEAAAVMGGRTNPVHGFDLEALKLDANFQRNLDLKSQYSRKQASPFPQKIDGREVKVVRGVLPNNQGQETLSFDAQSGLLVRRVTVLRTALGGIPQQYDYSDYRTVDGVKIPFVTKISTTANIQTRTITDAKFNVPMDDSLFAVPAASAGGAGGR